MAPIDRSSPSKRILIFDIENRPLSYWYDGNPTAEVTAIGWKWADDDETYSAAASKRRAPKSVVREFVRFYDEADIVLGHNIRRHDLPILNAACVENGLPILKPKLTIDTLRDLVVWKDIPKSLEYLCDLLGSPYEKFHMTQHSWREANRLVASGIDRALERVEVDVQATEWVWNELKRRDLLKGRPRTWKP